MILPLLFVYLKRINEDIDDFKAVKKILAQGIIFSAISLPLLLWYQIRNAICFGQAPFGVVQALDTLKVARTDFFSRWILNREFFDMILTDNASNVWAYVINSSIIFSANINSIQPPVFYWLKILSLILIIISIIALYTVTKKAENKKPLQILVATYVAFLIGFIVFNLELPYSCTMHARYLAVSAIIGIIYLQLFIENIKEPKYRKLLQTLVILFEILSVYTFIYLFLVLTVL